MIKDIEFLSVNGRFAKVISTAQAIRDRANIKNGIERGHVGISFDKSNSEIAAVFKSECLIKIHNFPLL